MYLTKYPGSAYLNLGVLAHVDAGKTSLTERLLYAAGVIGELGRVDDGNTQTDSLALERQRGITIQAAVVSFELGSARVNLIDTPGHPDFIAEVERSLMVLDGVVLVISAVEGVQAQTRVLWRALERLKLPTLIFVNKIDRRGAQDERLLRRIAETLTPDIVPLGRVTEPGTRKAAFLPYTPDDAAFVSGLLERLAEHDETLLAAYVEGEAAPAYPRLEHDLAEQTKCARVHPVFFGSAMTGAGIEALIGGIQALLPTGPNDPGGPLSGRVFKIGRGPAGEKIAYVRMISGTLRVRDRVSLSSSFALAPDTAREGKVTAIHVFEGGTDVQRPMASAGQIVKLWGLHDAQISDAVGLRPIASPEHHFAPPTLETLISPRQSADRAALHAALSLLAEGDPLINLRQDEAKGELALSLYGEVQKEVIAATLQRDFGLEATFQGTTPIYLERPLGVGEAVEELEQAGNPFLATVGLRVEPAPIGSGVTLCLEDGLTGVPYFIYKSSDAFRDALEVTVREALRQGLYGWAVTDCRVTVTRAGYVSPVSSAADFRKLTPLVLLRALHEAGTVVCEPLYAFVLELPTPALGPAASALARLGGVLRTTLLQGSGYVLGGDIPAAQVHALQGLIPALTGGEGVLDAAFSHYQPLAEPFPTRPRAEPDPLNRKAYLTQLVGFWGAKGQHVH